MLSLTPWRATTATLTTSWSRSIPRRPLANGSVDGHALGDDLARARRRSPGSTGPARARRNPPPSPAAPSRCARPTGATLRPRRRTASSSTTRPAADHRDTAQDSRSSITTRSARQPGATRPRSLQPEDARGRNAGGAIGGERRRAERDRGADDEIEVAFLGDVERIAVVGAEGDVRRIALGDDRRQRVQVLGHRAFAHQDLHALGQLLQRLRQVGGLVVGADAGGEIAVEVEAAEQRRVAVDRAALERRRAWPGRRRRRRAGRGSS